MVPVSTVPRLPPRDPLGHKGTFGNVVVIGGHAANPVMLGGPALAARAAFRSGCGLCTLAMPQPLLASALAVASSATGCPLPVDETGELQPSGVAHVFDPVVARSHAVVVGPGLGQSFAVQQIVLRLASTVTVPLVVDADGLNALAATEDFARDLTAPTVITPHAGEFSRLSHRLNLPCDLEKSELWPEAAHRMAQRLGCVVVLKGAHTVVSDGARVWVNTLEEPALATGGSGDVLAGLVGGLAAQFVGRDGHGPLDLFHVACVAVSVHARSAAQWAQLHGHAGMLALEIADGIPDAMASMRA